MKDEKIEIELVENKKQNLFQNENENKQKKYTSSTSSNSWNSWNSWLKTKWENYKKLSLLKKCLLGLMIISLIYVIIMIAIFISIARSGEFENFKNNNDLDIYSDDDDDSKYHLIDRIKYNSRIPMRIFKVKEDLVDYSLMNISSNACIDFYEYSCGNYRLGKQNELFEIIKLENELKSFINKGILKGDGTICMIQEFKNVDGCYNALEFYKYCVYDRNHGVQPIKLISKLQKKLNNITGSFQKIRFLIENGLTNYVHLTKEKNQEGIWTHYLRPGGVLFPSKTIHLSLYGASGLQSSQKKLMKIKDFLGVTSYKWIKIFGVHARRGDLIYVENLEYFENLNNLLNFLPNEEINNRLNWYIKNDINYLYSHNCLQQTNLLFPITFCRIFQRLSGLDDKQNGLEIAKGIYDFMNTKYDLTTSLRVGSCSSLLHSNNLGEELIKVENQKEIRKYLKNMNSLEWAQEFLFKKWYKMYDPIYLYFTYPRILDDYLDDPLDWYSQVNAFYDGFHNEVVVPMGIIQYPLYDEKYSSTGIYSRLGWVFGHEISHSIQHKMNLDCLNKEGDDEREKFELFADVFGLFNSFDYSFINFNDTDSCQFFLSFGQMFCSQTPDYKLSTNPHGSCRDRVNLSIKFASNNLLNEFNNCFNCKKTEKCGKLKK
jgi:hypothetical protein